MEKRNTKPRKKRVLESDAENKRRRATGAKAGGPVPFSSGKARDMRAQRSNRQGSGKPTQQRVEDR